MARMRLAQMRRQAAYCGDAAVNSRDPRRAKARSAMVPARKERSDRPRARRDGRRLAAIAFTDIVGYSILMASDERRTHARWMSILEEIIRPEAAKHHGVIVKSTGDGVLAEFPSALDAVEWAQAVQAAVAEQRGTEGAEDLIALRIAIHIGEVVSGRSDIYGDGVNLTARLQEHAPPGGIILSETARELLRGTVGAAARDLGLLRLKNFEGPVRAYALDPPRPALAVPVSTLETTLPSIAVLPFWNLGGDPKNEYFADGVVEDIIMSLAGLRELMVISRASTLFYSGRQPDPREVGRGLGVRYVLTGSIRRLGGTVRVSSQLCEAATGAALWAEQMEVGTEELFEVQDRIVSKIVGGIAPNVRGAELQRAMRKRPEVFTAYDHTLRALELISSLDRSTFPQARDLPRTGDGRGPEVRHGLRLGGALAQHQCRAGLVARLEGRRRRGREAGAARHRPRQRQRAGARDLRPRALVPVPRMRECARLLRSRPRRLPEPLPRLDALKRDDELSRARTGGGGTCRARDKAVAVRPPALHPLRFARRSAITRAATMKKR